ncbi:hypothetical protein KVR01_005629 [Diaporthe batatas]|uniref:uncharacterized protein n=1 Tax=Diaporthe batatas TaxID=748121 RepID=UPI001D0563A9|nr:uncharacterized protein KVR01_005629 [Diaporthe batatas]KAG8165354.1 hypothetical protein KVR01_005629 [Diaporthe batatas]
MSAERRFEQRRFRLEESVTQNAGARTVFIERMTPGTTVPPHYHTRFSETFDLLEGSLTVHSSKQEPTAAGDEGADLELLERSSTRVSPGGAAPPPVVPAGVYHKYVVGGGADAVLRCVVEPGHADFERLLMILNGLADDGELEAMGDSVLLMAVIMDLGDAHLLGPAKSMLDGVYASQRQEVADLKARLLAKYDNEENLKKLLAKN